MCSAAARSAILIVEDEPFIRMAAVDTMLDLGIEPYEAANATEALGMLEQHPEIEVVFTDVNMPGTMDGISLARRVTELRPGMGIILTSGRQHMSQREVPGNGTFLPKPYGPRQLMGIVARKLAEVAGALRSR
jgi:DNA-binding NtrC family response regulator